MLVLCTGTGCVRSNGTLSNQTFKKTNATYTIGEVPEGWRRVSLRGADIAYMYDKDGSTLLINSQCEDAEDAPLVALTFHLIIGMTEQNIIEQKAVASSDREGLVTTAEAKLDGVKRKFQMFVLKKDLCIFDIVLAARPSKFDERLPAFESVLKGFNVPGAKL
jgi:hypothetical protein